MTKILIILGIFLLLWISWGVYVIYGIEKPQYTVVESHSEYEIREYAAYLIAETEVEGNYSEATNQGFRNIADFIFGNNTAQDKVAMTSPVLTEEEKSEKIAMTSPVVSEKIAMTSPVVNEEQASGKWKISFIMPSEYTKETLPKPNTDFVTIREVPARKIAVITFGWWASDAKMRAKETELRGYLERDGLEIESIETARYNDPWTPPFMMTNEVWAILKD